MSLECDGRARDPAKVEDQVRLLAWTLVEHCDSAMFSTRWPASVMDSTTDFESVRRGSTPWRGAWKASQSTTEREMSYDYYLVIDLEATCCDQGTIPFGRMEIIEIGAVW